MALQQKSHANLSQMITRPRSYSPIRSFCYICSIYFLERCMCETDFFQKGNLSKLVCRISKLKFGMTSY